MTVRKGDTQSQKGCHTVTQPVLYPSYSLRGESAGAGAEAPPTISKLIWDEGIALISLHSKQPISKIRTLIGKWNKRASSDDDKDKLLAIIRAAKAAGSHDPVSYISKAVNETFPDPSCWSLEKWQRIIAIVIERGEWQPSLGPAPGKRGCVVPPELITAELIEAVGDKQVAA